MVRAGYDRKKTIYYTSYDTVTARSLVLAHTDYYWLTARRINSA